MHTDAPTRAESASADLSALMKIRNLELRARSIVDGYYQGLHRSPRHGYSAEFAEYSPYVPGDDIRYLDWKVLARRDRTFIRKFRDETNLQCTLLLDLSRSMSYGHGSYTKLEYARTLAATLAYLLYQQGDAIGLMLYDSETRDYLPPRHRRSHLHAILTALSKPAQGTSAALHTPVETILGRGRMRGIICVISDFLTPLESLRAPLSSLAACGHEVALLQTLDPTEIHFTFDKPMNFEDLESGRVLPADSSTIRDGYLKRFEAHQSGLKGLCDTLGLIHYRVPTDEALESVLHTYLADRQARGQRITRAVRI